MPDQIPPRPTATGVMRLLVAFTGQGPQKTPKSPRSDDPAVDPEFDRITRITRQLKFFMNRAALAHATGDRRAENESMKRANGFLEQLLRTTGEHPSPVILSTLDETADFLSRKGKSDAAIRSLSLYVRIATETGHFGFAADGLMKLGALYAGTGDADKAREKLGIAGQYYRLAGSAMSIIAFQLAGDVMQALEALTTATARARADGGLAGLVKSYEALVNALEESEPEYRKAMGDTAYEARVQKGLIGLMDAYHKALLDGFEYMFLAISHSAKGFVTPEWQKNVLRWASGLKSVIQDSSVLWGKTQLPTEDQVTLLRLELKREADRLSDGGARLEFFEMVRILSGLNGVTPDVIVSMIGPEADSASFRHMLAESGLDEDTMELLIEEVKKVTPARTMRRCMEALREVENRGL